METPAAVRIGRMKNFSSWAHRALIGRGTNGPERVNGDPELEGVRRMRTTIARIGAVGAGVVLALGIFAAAPPAGASGAAGQDRKSTRLNSSHANISYAVFCL